MRYLRRALISILREAAAAAVVRALVLLAIAIALPQMAQAQTHAIHMIFGPAGETQPVASSCTQSSCQKLVPRYDKKTWMVGILEYNTGTCMENTPGQWTDFPATTSNMGVVTTDFGDATGPACNPSGKWTYAVMYFAWHEHNNKSTPAPSLIVGYPMDQFSAKWSDPNTDGYSDSCGCTGPYTFVFNPFTTAVRPKGETGTVEGWPDSRADWRQTLLPPDDDPSFSFVGERVQETLLTGEATDTCAARAPTALAGTPSNSGATAAPPWTVGAGNKWGPDSVGYGGCAVEAYRCAAANIPPCRYLVPQEMRIKSPADSGFTYLYSKNTLGGGVGGSVPISIAKATRPFKQFWGIVQSVRSTPHGLGNPVATNVFESSTKNCFDYINLNACWPYK